MSDLVNFETEVVTDTKNLAKKPVKITLQTVLNNWKYLFVWFCSVLLPIGTAVTGLLLARAMDTEKYGEIAFFFSNLGLVTLIGSLGLTTQIRITTAKYSGSRNDTSLLNEIRSLLTVRLSSLLLFLFLVLVFLALHNYILAAGIGIGGLILLEEFFLGILQGTGRSVIATFLQILPTTLYLIIVVIINPKTTATNTVILIVFFSYFPSLLFGSILALNKLGIKFQQLLPSQEAIHRSLIMTGKVYLLTLILALYGMFGTFLLGTLGLFKETSAFALSSSIIYFPSSAFTLVHYTVFYPKFCRFVNEKNYIEAVAWFDIFYRFLFSTAISVSITVMVFSPTIISILFTDKYSFAANILSILAPNIVFILLNILVIWTMVAFDQFRAALFASLVQLLCLICGSFLAIAANTNFLSLFAFAHTFATFICLLISMGFLKKIFPFQLHLVKLGLVVALVGLLVIIAQHIIPRNASVYIELLTLGIISILSLLCGLIVTFSPAKLDLIKLDYKKKGLN